MELIIDFYKGLDTLNLIIFWGIIVVIILLLIFSLIMINKNKKLKKIVQENSNKYEEELPIKKDEIEMETNIEVVSAKEPKTLISEEETTKTENSNNIIEEENEFIAEEHIMEYQQEMPQEKKIKKPIAMPTGPYQRNVLREMSLSQTSPIGINRQIRNDEKKIEMAKDLVSSLSHEQTNNTSPDHEDEKKEDIQNNTEKLNAQIKKDLTDIENTSSRKTEVKNEYPQKDIIKYDESKKNYHPESKKETSIVEEIPRDLLNINSNFTENQKENNVSRNYLEEVSKKLSEAEIPDEIERTNYELQQEEDAIISYKELMEKKDSIQTIDEEEAIISIEELMNRNNKKTEEMNQPQTSKLYNLTETEENDDFIKELKQFRKDL